MLLFIRATTKNESQDKKMAPDQSHVQERSWNRIEHKKWTDTHFNIWYDKASILNKRTSIHAKIF